MTSHVTQVALVFVDGRINDRLRFGRPLRERRFDRHVAVAMFAPGNVFGYIR